MRLQATETFQWGAAFERALSAWCQLRGMGILPVYNYSGAQDNKPPLLEVANGSRVGGGLVLPDMLACGQGRSTWFEAKRRSRADYTRLTQQLETGFSLRLYRHYLKIAEQSGLPVLVFFGHEAENEVRYCELGVCPVREYTGSGMGHAGMAFFGWDTLTFLARMDEVMACLPGVPSAHPAGADYHRRQPHRHAMTDG